jgi:hypothetical protein
MRSLGTTGAVLIGAVLALLLLAYVFTGRSSRRADTLPHCVSRQSLDLVKGELFHRAAATRGANDPALVAAANYSVIRTGSRIVRDVRKAAGGVTCSGSLVIDLPPTLAAAGGRHELSSTLRYVLAGPPGQSERVVTLSGADAIVSALATVTKAAADQAAGPISMEPEIANLEMSASPPAAQVAQPAKTAETRAQASENRPVPEQEAAPSPPRQRPSPPPAVPEPAHTAKTSAPAPHPPAAAAKPSFNCRYARTRGEIAICKDRALAGLDREMAAQFNRALSGADPDQRAVLRRTRNRFLSYRDSCTSASCIADAYRGRMREISDIMAGRW